MARYIDADKIDYTVTVVGQDECAGYRAVAFKSDIDDMPAADVVKVVRCKDCKHATFYSCKNDACYRAVICEYQIGIGDENFYCSCGERKTEEVGEE